MAIDQQLAALGRPAPAAGSTVERALEHAGIVFRRPDVAAGEHRRLVALQEAVWAPEMATPAHQLIAAESCGGIVLGAFRGGEAIGLSYAFPAHRSGAVWLHSHQTGVQKASRDHGVGATLKWLQRWLALQEGYGVITWTFDPLQSRNAHFNFSKLGVVARTYKIDCYGPLPDASNRDLPTDRLWVEWHLRSPGVVSRFADCRTASGLDWFPGSRYLNAQHEVAQQPIAAGPPAQGDGVEMVSTRADGDGVRMPLGRPSLDSKPPVLRLEVPADVELVRKRHGTAGTTAWRMVTRQAFVDAFERGYVATGFTTAMTDQGRRSWYLLARPDG